MGEFVRYGLSTMTHSPADTRLAMAIVQQPYRPTSIPPMVPGKRWRDRRRRAAAVLRHVQRESGEVLENWRSVSMPKRAV